MIEIRPARAADIRPIAAAMRPMDRLECAAFGLGPREALRRGHAAGRCVTIEIDGRPEAMAGVSPASLVTGTGRPWMLAGTRVMSRRKAWLEHAPEVLAVLSAGCRRLENLVHADNTASIRWLRRLGFDFDTAVTAVGGQPFMRFFKDVP
jgi:hypothetical protein